MCMVGLPELVCRDVCDVFIELIITGAQQRLPHRPHLFHLTGRTCLGLPW
jgi:hypothetical protein